MTYPYDGMFYPTLPEDTQDFNQVLSGVGRSLRDISRGISYYPYDLLGSGVDVANLALGAAGLGSERPVLGSDYLRNIARSLGMAQEPTGSATENITRLAAGLTNPMAGARAVGRVGDITTEQANRAADALVRQITGNPQATAPQVLQETAMPFMQAIAPKIVRPGDKVSGLTVREEVPNVSSIPASLDDYEILSGIREVPRGAFDKEYLDSLSFENLDKRTKDLARQIQESKEINPMIVGVDSKGAYIIEGGHRFDALMAQDTKSIPAMVVVDKSDPPSDDVLKGLLEPKTSKFEMPSFASLRPETTDDVDKIYDYLEKQAKKSGFRVESGASNVSNSRYLTIEKDLGNDEISTIEVRISAHGDRHPFTYATDGKISIDPSRGGVDLETTLWDLQEKGYDLIK